MNLYEIEQAMLDCIDPETGEIDEEKLACLELERDSKVENIALWIKDLTAEETALKNEIRALTDRKSAAANKRDRLKKYLQDFLGGEKFKTPKVSISYRKTKSVEIDPGVELREEYVNIVEVPDKRTIAEVLKMGGEIHGCRLVEKQSMSIK